MDELTPITIVSTPLWAGKGGLFAFVPPISTHFLGALLCCSVLFVLVHGCCGSTSSPEIDTNHVQHSIGHTMFVPAPAKANSSGDCGGTCSPTLVDHVKNWLSVDSYPAWTIGIGILLSTIINPNEPSLPVMMKILLTKIHQQSSINDHQWSSMLINAHQWSSLMIQHPQAPATIGISHQPTAAGWHRHLLSFSRLHGRLVHLQQLLMMASGRQWLIMVVASGTSGQC